MQRYLPFLDWGRSYSRQTLGADLVAALIVTVMLIPQSFAYALLAGLPPVLGLYASMAPLVLYALFGTSRTLAVGPVAISSLMSAAACGALFAQGTPEFAGAAVALAALSGGMLVVMGLLRLGFLANFLSHPVISGFITASALLIAAGQLRHLLGVQAGGATAPELVPALLSALPGTNAQALTLGLAAIGFLVWARRGMAPALRRIGLPERLAATLARTGPVIAVALTTLATWALGLDIAVVGDVPRGLPVLALPPLDPGLLAQIAVPALLISVVGYVENVSIAQTLAARRRERIDPDQELIALGAANLGAAVSGAFPVSGGFSRSVVNFDAGARTPAAGLFTAAGMALATLFLTPLIRYLPQATLAATIVVAVLGLVDVRALVRVWRWSRADFIAQAGTILVTLGAGVERGLICGVGLSVALQLWRSSRPHVAVVGQVPGCEHFRNVARHEVVTAPHVLSLRVDESLSFPNARFLEDYVYDAVAADPRIRHVVLVCAAVNAVDASALESLEAINHRLQDAGVTLHLSEVKGPVMDGLRRAGLPDTLTGEVFLSQYDAFRTLAPEAARIALAGPRQAEPTERLRDAGRAAR
ncbi:sulfate permease [Paroceanicella profunda]|uniref:Sulfate permease n=1 Tax=Paroceanicella profunda TaxID=2579971 RepID=A0A5B8FG92_9RHOB|nr:sulfate permease [Paroceanicella profunda]QDL90847.1 sulfate permease [Paroceanicella profunda]